MKGWFATVTNLKNGDQFEVGGFSEEELNSTLLEVNAEKNLDLKDCVVEYYTMEM